MDRGLRKPVLQHYSETPDTTGQVDVLTMERRMQGVWHGPMLKLKSITAGLPPLNPTELLNSRRFADPLKQVRGQFDYVLVDTPRVTVATDYYAVVGALGGGVLLVMDARGTRKKSLRRAIQDLEGVGPACLAPSCTTWLSAGASTRPTVMARAGG